MRSELVGASLWEEQLYEHLVSHAQEEQHLLGPYREAATASGSAAFRYLVSLIVEDEERHHRLFAELAESLRIDAEFRPEQPRVPHLDLAGPDRDDIVQLTSRFLEQERQDARQLKHLKKELADVKDTTLWSLLVELMEADTAKHISILKFIEHHDRR